MVLIISMTPPEPQACGVQERVWEHSLRDARTLSDVRAGIRTT
jgi:hypothetical protein